LADLKSASTMRGGGWQALPPAARTHLQELLGNRAESFYREQRLSVSTVRATGRSIRGLLEALPRRYVVGSTIALLLACVVLVWGAGWVHWAAALSGLAALYALLRGGADAWDKSRPLRDRSREVWQAVKGYRDEQFRRLETAEAVAAAEVAELELRLQNFTAAGQLAGLVEERAGTGSYRERLGLMTQIRQDFERMAELLLDDSSGQPEIPVMDAAGDELPSIDRIVIYIDDLDRCPPQRVVEVLEAIHLLLAVRLFVVVVAVDPRWLLRSLTSHYQQLFAASKGQHNGTTRTSEGLTVDLGEDELWASTPAQYLEKIFQIVMTLPPMEQDGYLRMIDDFVGVQATPNEGPTETPVQTSPLQQPTVTAPRMTRSPRARSRSARTATTPSEPQRFSLDLLQKVEQVDPLTFTPDEHQFMSLLGPPLISAPRAVKRLANSYGLLAAISTTNGLGRGRPELLPLPDINPQQEAYPYRAGMALLAAVIGFPMLGPTFFPDIHNTAQGKPSTRWDAHIAGLQPELGDKGWANRIEVTMTPTRAQHWKIFLDALGEIGRRAERAGLPVPQRLDIWAKWVVPVGRLSFPTGSAVSRLTEPQDL
jgi:hypothetical protein